MTMDRIDKAYVRMYAVCVSADHTGFPIFPHVQQMKPRPSPRFVNSHTHAESKLHYAPSQCQPQKLSLK